MYKLIRDVYSNVDCGIIRLSDNASIPFDPANTDYQTYMKWLDGYEWVNREWVKTSDGNTPEPADQTE